MDPDERETLLKIALAAQALLDRLDTLTTEEFSLVDILCQLKQADSLIGL